MPPIPSEIPDLNASTENTVIPEPTPPESSAVLPPPVITSAQVQKMQPSPQVSLAALLQGGKKQLRKKTSQPSAVSLSTTDEGSSQSSSNPSQAFNPSNPSTDVPQSNLPPGPLSNPDQFHQLSGTSSPQDLSQSTRNQSFDSVGKTVELENSREGDDYDSRDRQRRHEDSYYQDRRDSPYNQDRRDSYDHQSRQDPYYEQERDYERQYYDRRDPERRNYDRRRDYERRESDYGRRSYDREFDNRSYDGRDYSRRDSYDNRDAYYSHGYSPHQGRRGYDDGRSSREDMYRGSYHSGRGTPSSLDRNSPAPYDHYSSYASHQYGYPSYTEAQSMDLYQYQYLMYLYQFHPQHYEQYCAQLGYYNMGYTPEQLAQYYGSMYNSSGYESAQPTEQGLSGSVIIEFIYFVS